MMLSAAEFLVHEERLHRPIEQRYYISHRECNASRRCVLINWMSEVIVYHGMHRETFHLAVSLLDRFVEQTNVPKQELQLYGAACILASGKLKEIYPPEVSDYCTLCDWKYTKREMCDAELDILFTLEWRFNEMTAVEYFGLLVTKLLAGLTKQTASMQQACCEIYEKGCALLDLAVHHPLSLCYTECELALAVFAHSTQFVFRNESIDMDQYFGLPDNCRLWVESLEKCPGQISLSRPTGIDSQTIALNNEKALSFLLSQIKIDK